MAKNTNSHLISHRKISSNLYFSFSAGLSRRLFFIITQINVLSVDTCPSKITLSQIFSLTIYSIHQSGDISASSLNVVRTKNCCYFSCHYCHWLPAKSLKKKTQNNLIHQFNVQ